ncbi:MAG: iron ABC transporter permease [Planctomycetales bacterium]|nr:iron ABC transporter permease [Planctomycetales bacterium]
MTLALVGLVAIVFWFSADARTQFLLKNSARLVAGMWAIALPAGVSLAVLLVKTDMPCRRLILAILVALAFMPLAIQAGAWQAGLGVEGVWRSDRSLAPQIAGLWGAIWVHGLAAAPWIALFASLGLLRVERELEEAMLLDAPPWIVLVQVSLRRAGPAILAGALWTAAQASADISVTDLFQVRTFAEEIYTGIAVGDWTDGQPLEATTSGALFALFAAVAILGVWQLTMTFPTRYQSPWRWRLGAGRWLALGFAVVILLFTAGLPLGHLIHKAGIQVEQAGTQRERTWSARQCVVLVASGYEDHRTEYDWSLQIAATAATAAVFLALPLAWLAREGSWKVVPATVVAALTLAMPGPLLGLALIEWMNRPDLPWLATLYDRTILAPALAQLFKALPPVILVLMFGFASIPQAVLETARLDGLGRWRACWHVGIASRRANLVAAWIAGFVVAWGELSATILVAPPGVSTVPIRLFGLLHYGVQDQVAGICLVTILGVVILGATVAWMTHVRESSD